jgi:hypothetical protein
MKQQNAGNTKQRMTPGNKNKTRLRLTAKQRQHILTKRYSQTEANKKYSTFQKCGTHYEVINKTYSNTALKRTNH